MEGSGCLGFGKDEASPQGQGAGSNRSMGNKLTFRRLRNGVRMGIRILPAWLLLMAAGGGMAWPQGRSAPAYPTESAYATDAADPMGVGEQPETSVSYAVGQQPAPAPAPQGQPLEQNAGASPNRVEPNPQSGGGGHLAQWMNRHSWMTLEQLQQALNQEPGFNLLSPQAQYRMHQRLAQLYAMKPLQRQRTLAHVEAMERLTPQQRSQVRGAMQQLASLPLAQRRQVIRLFRELRSFPPRQRWRLLNSPQFDWMDYHERTVLTSLVQVAPLLPQH